MNKPQPSFVRGFIKSSKWAKLVQSEKIITIFGYGSLMDKQSLMTTMPSATNIRPGILPGYRRVFSLISRREDAKLGIGSFAKNNNNAVAAGVPDPSCAGIMGALTVVESNDEVVRMKIGELGGATTDPIFERYCIGQLWGRQEIRPAPRYLERCLHGAENLFGKEGRDNFLDTSYLVDRVTTIREYVEEIERIDSNK